MKWAGAHLILAQVAIATWKLFTCLLQPSLLGTVRFWVFVYLVFCIGSAT